jgi:hypothetical protein
VTRVALKYKGVQFFKEYQCPFWILLTILICEAQQRAPDSLSVCDEYLSRVLRVDRRTARKRLATLESLGVITVTKRPRYRRTNWYTIEITAENEETAE